jgi:2-polyprenyl-6-methoxyphenol hydroxylase-like FAD-dependent oxidoreductase
MTPRRTVTIAGGGIGGLALAAALDPHRFDVTVVEPRAELPEVGTSLAMWPEAQRALDQLGVLEEPTAVSPSLTRFPIRWFDGRTIVATDVPPTPLVGRRDLLAALDAAVPAGVRRVRGRIGGSAENEFEPSADGIVVGADGVHSGVRRRVWPAQAAAIATPFLAVRGVLPESVGDEDMGEYWGRGRLFGIGPHRSGTNWYMSFRSALGPRRVDVGEALDEARAHAADAPRTASAIERILEAAAPAGTLAQRIWVAPKLPRYTSSRHVLIGDAAHAMTPNLGRGGCEALIDAVTLARLLATLPDQEALAAYDRQRRARTRRLAVTSARIGRLALAERAQPLRDLVLRGVGIVAAAEKSSRAVSIGRLPVRRPE